MINKKTIYFSGIIFGLLMAFFGFNHQVLADDPMCCVGKDGAGTVQDCELYVENNCPPKDIVCLKYAKGNIMGGEQMQGECTESIPIINSKEPCLSYGFCLSRVLSPTPILNLSEDYQKDITFGESATVVFTADLSSYITDAALKDLPVSFNCELCTGSGANLSGGTVPLSGGQTNLTFVLDTGKLHQEFQDKVPVTGELIIKVNAQINGKSFLSKNLTFNLKQFDCPANNGQACKEANNKFCFLLEGKCMSRLDINLCSQLTKYPQLCGTQADGSNPGSTVCYWNKQLNQCQGALGKGISEQYAPPPGYEEGGGIIPPCAFSGQCRSVNDILDTVIRFGKSFFAIIGSFAFVFFIYGGLTMILSFGNAEKTKKGRDILVAAVIGLIIVFSAYLLISFVLGAIGVQSSFKGI